MMIEEEKIREGNVNRAGGSAASVSVSPIVLFFNETVSERVERASMIDIIYSEQAKC